MFHLFSIKCSIISNWTQFENAEYIWLPRQNCMTHFSDREWVKLLSRNQNNHSDYNLNYFWISFSNEQNEQRITLLGWDFWAMAFNKLLFCSNLSIIISRCSRATSPFMASLRIVFLSLFLPPVSPNHFNDYAMKYSEKINSSSGIPYGYQLWNILIRLEFQMKFHDFLFDNLI